MEKPLLGEKATYNLVRQSLPTEKAKHDSIHSPYSYYVLGGLSMRLAPWFINRGLSANAVTVLGLLTLLLSLLCFTAGGIDSAWFLVGAVLLHLLLIADNIDGHIARFKHECSKAGDLADNSITWLHHSLLPVCLGYALYQAAPQSLVLSFPPEWWLAAGLVRCYCTMLYIIMGYKTQSLLAGLRYQDRTNNITALRLLRLTLEAEALFLILGVLFSIVDIVFLFYALFHSCVLLAAFLVNFRDLHLADSKTEA